MRKTLIAATIALCASLPAHAELPSALTSSAAWPGIREQLPSFSKVLTKAMIASHFCDVPFVGKRDGLAVDNLDLLNVLVKEIPEDERHKIGAEVTSEVKEELNAAGPLKFCASYGSLLPYIQKLNDAMNDLGWVKTLLAIPKQ
jgi:hypothetical protein